VKVNVLIEPRCSDERLMVPTPADVTEKVSENPGTSPLEVGFSVKIFPADMVTV